MVENLFEQFTFVKVPLDAIKKEYRSEYEDEAYEDEDGYVYAAMSDIEDMSQAEWDSSYFDDEMFYDNLQNMFAKEDYAGYLVIHYNAGWQNSTGFATFNTLREMIESFDYDFSLYLEESKGHIVKFGFGSHDSPYGSKLEIVGVEDDELFEYLEDNYEFDTAMKTKDMIANDQLNEATHDLNRDPDEMTLDLYEDVKGEFEVQGWDETAAIPSRIFSVAARIKNMVGKQNFIFDPSIGIAGGFRLDPESYQAIADEIADMVTEIIETAKANQTDRTAKGSKKWNKKGKNYTSKGWK